MADPADVNRCIEALRAVLEIYGLELQDGNTDVQKLYQSLENLRTHLRKSSSDKVSRVGTKIAKAAKSTCKCGHPLWAHNKYKGCLHVVATGAECACAQYVDRRMTVPCPKCGASEGHACRMKDGEVYPNAGYFHAARVWEPAP